VTLILTVLTRKHVVQVSDRRICETFPDGRIRVATDNENKALYVVGSDCHFAVAYTGLARVGTQTTDSWLSGQFCKANLGYQPYAKILAHLNGPVLQPFRNHAPRLRGSRIDTTIVVAGIKASASGQTDFFVTSISTGSPWHFNIVSKPPKEFVVAHGSVQAMSGAVCDEIRKLSDSRFFRREDGETVAAKLVSLVRKVSDDPRYGKYVGRGCLSNIVYPDPHVVNVKRYDDPDATPLTSPVVATAIIVMGGSAIRWKATDRKFNLGTLRIGESVPTPTADGATGFRLSVSQDPPKLTYETTD
jgi:hypothetical protein